MTAITRLKPAEVTKRMRSLPGWSINAAGTQISRTFKLSSFITGLSFIAKITVHAEIMEHHPDIELSYGKVKVKLSTHDVRGLSKADFELAKKIDGITIL